MESIHIKVIVAILITVGIFLSGFWLNKMGKPYSVFFLTVHKLISFGFAAYIIISCYRLNKVEPFISHELVLCWSMIIVYGFSIASGGFLSTGNPMPDYMRMIHKFGSFVSVLLTGMFIYLVRGRL